jgi:hypothetical protein
MDFDHSREERRGTRAPLLIFEHRRFLRVERSATLRSGQKGVQDLESWGRIPSGRHAAAGQILEMQLLQAETT